MKIIQKQHYRLFVAAFVFIISAMSLLFPITAFAESSLSTVGSNYMGDWVSVTQSTANGSYSKGPHAQILGQGSYEMRTGLGKDGVGGMVFLINTSYAGTNLGSLNRLEYSTYTASAISGNDIVPRLVISAKINGQQTKLTYVNDTHQHPQFSIDRWTTWPVLDGVWISSEALTDTEGKIAIKANQPVAWTDIVSLDSRGAITSEGVRIEAGQQQISQLWSQYVGYVDKIVINQRIYDLEPVSHPGSVTINEVNEAEAGNVAVRSFALAANVTVETNDNVQRVFTSRAAYLAAQYELNFTVPEITSERLVAAKVTQSNLSSSIAQEIRAKVRDRLRDKCQFGAYWDDHGEWEKCDDKKKKDKSKDKDKDKKRHNRS